jgi:hypothetical protein
MYSSSECTRIGRIPNRFAELWEEEGGFENTGGGVGARNESGGDDKFAENG